jgi:hypothetical protein
VGNHQVRLAERAVIGLLAVGDDEEHVGESRPAGEALGLDESARVGVDPDDAPGPRREVEGEAAGPGPDVQNGPAIERLGVQPRDQSGR